MVRCRFTAACRSTCRLLLLVLLLSLVLLPCSPLALHALLACMVLVTATVIAADACTDAGNRWDPVVRWRLNTQTLVNSCHRTPKLMQAGPAKAGILLT